MKAFKDLTDLERSELTDDQIADYIDIMCAENGAPLLPMEPFEVVKTKVEKKDKVYAVRMPYDTYFDLEIAQSIVNFINKQPMYESCHIGNYNSPEYIQPKSNERLAEVIPSTFYTRDDAILQNNINKTEKAALEEYKEAKQKYDKALQDRSPYVERVYEDIRESGKRVAVRRAYVSEWERYIKLANKDHEIAKNFFINRYNLQAFEELCDELPELDFLLERELIKDDIACSDPE